MVTEVKCPNCKTNEKVVKLGITYVGRRRYGCKGCHKSFYDLEGEQRELERLEKEEETNINLLMSLKEKVAILEKGLNHKNKGMDFGKKEVTHEPIDGEKV